MDTTHALKESLNVALLGVDESLNVVVFGCGGPILVLLFGGKCGALLCLKKKKRGT
jgi:hypothetical protein